MAPRSSAKSGTSSERLTLNQLAPADGATQTKKRVGRGRATGCGKTSSRGHNGQGQRSGNSAKRGFEGGQMPLFRRLPIVDGFRIVNQRRWLELNVGDLEALLPDGQSDLTYEVLRQARRYNPNKHDGVRILGNGELKRKLSIQAHHVTPQARQKIEAAGGAITILTTTVN